jgi:hypothetical protein
MYRTCDPGKLSLLRKEKLRYQGKEEQDAKLTTQEADYLRRHEATEVVREEKRRERAERKEKERDEKARQRIVLGQKRLLGEETLNTLHTCWLGGIFGPWP